MSCECEPLLLLITMALLTTLQVLELELEVTLCRRAQFRPWSIMMVVVVVVGAVEVGLRWVGFGGLLCTHTVCFIVPSSAGTGAE